MSTYQVISNMDEILKFMEMFGPKFEGDIGVIKFIHNMNATRVNSQVNYSKGDNQVLSIKLLNNISHKDNYKTISEFEVPTCTYKIKGSYNFIPKGETSLLMYINSRDTVKSWIEVNSLVVKRYMGEDKAINMSMVNLEYIKTLLKYPRNNEYSSISIKSKGITFTNKIKDILSSYINNIKYIIETFDGYEIIYLSKTIDQETINNLNMLSIVHVFKDNKAKIRIIEDPVVPIPGTSQGLFIVKNLHIKSFFDKIEVKPKKIKSKSIPYVDVKVNFGKNANLNPFKKVHKINIHL